MDKTAVYRGQACFRFPYALHSMLYELRAPGATPWELAECRGWLDPDALRWKIIKIVKATRPGSAELVDSVVLTPWGERLATLIKTGKIERSIAPPLIPIRDLLAVCTPQVRDAVCGETPLERSDPGSFFEAVGVLTLHPRGDSHYLRSAMLLRAMEEIAAGRDGPEYVLPFLTDEQTAFLRQCLTGLPAKDAALDGRSIKPLTTGFMGLVDLDSDGVYRAVPSMRAFVSLVASGVTDPMPLFDALPELDKVWLATALVGETDRPHTYLLRKMGWLYKKGAYWALTKTGKELQPNWADHLRGAPAELMLPEDLPVPPDDFSILGEPDGPEVEDIYAVDFGALDMMVQTTERVIGKHPALAAPYTPAPPPRIDNLYATTSAKEDDDFDIL